MKVTVSVFGRLHAFYLAEQLYRRDALDRLYTTYPRFEVTKYGIPAASATCWPAVEAAFRLYLKLPGALRGQDRLLLQFMDLHDRLTANHLTGGMDIFHGWSQCSERSLLRARSLGAITTLQRGSAHIETQRDILREEYETHGVTGELPHQNIVDRERREYELADCIFVPSEFARQTFLARGIPPASVRKVPLGVSLHQFQGHPARHDVFRVIYAGTMSLRKGVHYLLQAFAELELPNAELWLVGQMLPEIEPFFAKYQGSFRYLGKVRQAELAEYYRQSSLFALCSIEDGFGVVLTQAMACGLPVLCTTNTGGPDILADGVEGFVVPIRDVEAIKERLLFLHEHRDACHEMGERARRRAVAALSWEDYGERIYTTFQQLLAGHQQGCRSAG